MEEKPEKSKVYLAIVKEIRQIILEGKLGPGDKIPSERELSEQLNVGRSSVREALRALELLGLIETRRGEGTFLLDFRNHHLLKWLGMFILQDPQIKQDVLNTKLILEKDIIRNLCVHVDKNDLTRFQDQQLVEPISFEKVLDLSENRLLFRIWEIVKNYSTEVKQVHSEDQIGFISELLTALIAGDEVQALSVYKQYQELI
ncbi:FadR/GntR family transcriptional regulator [Bacillus sp. FSL K6-3431]|uniref:FadR/GntR family transcriptional regulator n=1 Tax=Bacillus sp. FSL K6-3431 TaxID=2921500 RepID=UPI0030FA03EC